jgi:hypothetical protein
VRKLPVALLGLLVLILANCTEREGKADVGFAKSAFEALVRGDSGAEGSIDWETFHSLNNNVGALYIALETEEERAKFRRDFVTQFSSSFRESGGSFEAFTNWRATAGDGIHTEVAADSPGGLLRLTVSRRDDRERLSAISMEK